MTTASACEHWGWDIGGAHLKVARVDSAGRLRDVHLVACPLWTGLDALDRAASKLPPLPAGGRHAITMTGELVDLFEDREAGVRALLGWVERRLQPAPVQVFAAPGRWLTTASAADQGAAVGSANWLATMLWVAQRISDCLVVDIGSTTTDMLAIVDGRPVAPAAGDAARLVSGQLLYTGVVRTPVMTLAEQVPFAGHWQPLMAEYFATAADIYRVVGQLPAGADRGETADGAEATPEASARRLMRMLGRDYRTAEHAAAVRVAEYFADRQRNRLALGLERLRSQVPRLGRDTCLVAAGVGRFLARSLAMAGDYRYVDFGTLLDGAPDCQAAAADSAPAAALALLAATGELDVVA